MEPTLTRWGGLSNWEVSTGASERRARLSDGAAFDQNKQIYLSTLPSTGFNTEIVVTFAFPSWIATPLEGNDAISRSANDVAQTESDAW